MILVADRLKQIALDVWAIEKIADTLGEKQAQSLRLLVDDLLTHACPNDCYLIKRHVEFLRESERTGVETTILELLSDISKVVEKDEPS